MLLLETIYTGDRTLVLADCDMMLRFDSTSGVTLTIPTNSVVSIPVGQVILGYQGNSGSVTIAAASGVTLRAPGNRVRTSEIWGQFSIWKRGLDEWLLIGDML